MDQDYVKMVGDSVFYVASWSGNEDEVQLQQNKGATKLKHNSNVVKETDLYNACENGFVGILQELLEKGADMECVYQGGDTILHIASKSGNEDVVKILLKKGAKKLLNYPNYKKETALYIACLAGHAKVVEELIEKGADMDCVDQYGDTLLHAASNSGNEDVVQLLLNKGAKKLINHLNNKKETALYIACEKGHVEILQELLEKGADMDCVDQYGDTILHAAICTGNENVAHILLNNGAKKLINYPNYFKETPFFIACLEGQAKLIEELIEKGADMGCVDQDGDSVLHAASRSGNVDVVQLLMKKGATNLLNGRNDKKQTALIIACKKGHVQIIEEMIEKGADMDCADQFGGTILHAACKSGKEDVVKVLLMKGAIKILNHQNDFKDTALHVACRENYPQMAIMMIDHGANIYLKNSDGCTPFHIAGSCIYDVLKVTLLKEAFTNDKDVKNSTSGNSLIRVKILNNFIDRCVFELEDMKRFKISENFTLYTVFFRVKNPLHLRKTTLERKIRNYVQSTDCSDRFPLYVGFLNEAFLDSKRRITLLTKADQELSTIMRNYWWGELPVEVKDLVLQHLTNTDLEKLETF